jgi:hypothetical protein
MTRSSAAALVLLVVAGIGLTLKPQSAATAATRRSLTFKQPESDLARAAIQASQAKTVVVPNWVLIQNQSNQEQRRRPVTLSRSFAAGEIPHCPQAVVANEPIETQCDVKTRWPDSSVRHAILSFFVDLPADGSTRVEFRDQPEQTGATGLSKEEMLGFLDGHWDARLRVWADGEQAGEPVVRSVREILEAWDGQPSDAGVRYWLKGPIVTQVIVEDRHSSRFDFGWNTPAQRALLSNAVRADALDLPLRPGFEQAVRQWKIPGLVFVANEVIEVCDVVNNTLRVCPKGRGKQGRVPYSLRSGDIVGPAGDWRAATEDRFKSLHPVFILTFYRGWNGVKVDYILENSYTNRQQTQVYHVELFKGATPEPVGAERWLVQWPGSRWREQAWSGEEPAPIHINHNIPYLVYAHALPSYDIGRGLPASAVQSSLNNFLRSDRGEPMGNANWAMEFEAPGGRGELAFTPLWYVRYLFSSHPDLWPVVLGNAAASGSAPVHFREADPNLPYCPISCAESPRALGRHVSLEARPNFPDASMQQVGVTSRGGWSPDLAHLGEFAFVPYLLTGDYYFLEELQFWAAHATTYGSNPASTCHYCRHEDWGYISGEPRARAWGLRTTGLAALMTPDGAPEKNYFTDKFNNIIAVDEGYFDIRNGSFYEPCPSGAYNPRTTTRWCYGNQTIAAPNWLGPSNPLYSFMTLRATPVDSVTYYYTEADFPRNPPSTQLPDPDGQPAYSFSPEWQHNFHLVVTGSLLDLGLTQIAELHVRRATRLLLQLRSPDFNPYLVSVYHTPEFACIPKLDEKQGRYVCTPGPRFQTIKDVFLAFKGEVRSPQQDGISRKMDSFRQAQLIDPIGGYVYYARAASSFLPGLVYEGLSGAEAWEWMEPRAGLRSHLDDVPMWSFVPRARNHYGQ